MLGKVPPLLSLFLPPWSCLFNSSSLLLPTVEMVRSPVSSLILLLM